jgi:hypothetical protein
VIRRLLFLGALALASGAAARFVFVPVPAIATSPAPSEAVAFAPPPPVAGHVPGGWSVAWTQPAPGLIAMDLSSDGRGITWVDDKGVVRLVDAASARTLWRTRPLPGVNVVAAVPGAEGASAAVLAYSRLNPSAAHFYVLPRAAAGAAAQATQEAARRVDGAVWDIAVSFGGEHALIGTGRRSLYILPLRGRSAALVAEGGAQSPRRLMKTWQAPGIPGSLAITDAEPLALAATWHEAGVSAYSLDGSPRWRHDEADAARLYQVRVSADGKTAVAVSARAPRESGVRLHVWDADSGENLFVADLPGANHPRVLVSADGNCVAVTYLRMTHYRTGDVTEHRLAAWDRAGRPLFKEKGGSGFFSPDDIVALSKDGERITVQDRRRNLLYTLDARGNFVHQMRLPAAVSKTPRVPPPAAPLLRQTVATPDGAFLLVHRGDGQISLLKAAPAAL